MPPTLEKRGEVCVYMPLWLEIQRSQLPNKQSAFFRPPPPSKQQTLQLQHPFLSPSPFLNQSINQSMAPPPHNTLFLLIILFTIFLQIKALKAPIELENFTRNLINGLSPSNSPTPLPVKASNSDTPLVPALFVLGDSSVDSGTNNFLTTYAHANTLPYGRDFDTHTPTGRFCNGRIPVDFLASRLGLPLVPPFLGQGGSVHDMKHGVNYASAGAGIIFSSGSELGQHISLTQQIQQVQDTFQQFILRLGEEEATDIISESVFYLSIGSNDYIHYYLRNVSGVQKLYLPWSFSQLLATTVKEEMKNLYNANVRKMVVAGLAPIGCAPHYLWQYNSKNGECVKEINDVITEFNFAMRYMVEELAQEYPDYKITFCDVFEGSMDIMKNREQYGFEVTTAACCGLGPYNGWILCLSPEMACSNASNHLWWDQFHPTDAVNSLLADNVWSGQHMKMCYPTHLREMIAPNARRYD